jgi:hypothetical protein
VEVIPNGAHRIPDSTPTDLDCGKDTTAFSRRTQRRAGFNDFQGDKSRTVSLDFGLIFLRSRVRFWLGLDYSFECQMVSSLQWITGADFCADALRIMADEQLAAKGTNA